MRILQISNFFPPKTSGHGLYCFNLSKRLAQRGHQVKVITSRIPKNVPIKENMNGIEVERIPSYGTGWGISALNFIIPRLLNQVENYDVVHLHSYLFIISNQTAIVKRIKNFPLMLHLHGGLEIPDRRMVGRLKPAFKEYLYDPTIGKWTVHAADKIISVSRRDMKTAIIKFDIPDDKITWIPNSVDPSIFKYTEKNATGKIAFIGRLEQWKGAGYLVELSRKLFKALPETRLTVVGGGSMKHLLIKESKGLPIDFKGYIPHEQIPQVLEEVDILVMPSLLEGIPSACLEAFSCGVPVVAFDVGGMRDVIENNKTGFLVKTGDLDGFVFRVTSLLKDDELRKRLGKEARKTVEKKYTWQSAISKIERNYREIIK